MAVDNSAICPSPKTCTGEGDPIVRAPSLAWKPTCTERGPRWKTLTRKGLRILVGLYRRQGNGVT
jgi:hypothetical protein